MYVNCFFKVLLIWLRGEVKRAMTGVRMQLLEVPLQHKYV